MNNLKCLIIAIAFLNLFSSYALSDDKNINPTMFIPTDSHMIEVSRGVGGASVQYSGKEIISGNFIIRWNPVYEDDVPEKNKTILGVTFKPKESDSLKLPHIVNRAEPEAVYLQPAEDAVKKLLSSKQAKSILSKKVNEIMGTANITIENYFVEVVCDQESYYAHLVSVDGIANVAIFKKQKTDDIGGC